MCVCVRVCVCVCVCVCEGNAGLWDKSESEKVAQLYPTLCETIEYTVHGILQVRILEWAAIPFSRGSSQPRN